MDTTGQKTAVRVEGRCEHGYFADESCPHCWEDDENGGITIDLSTMSMLDETWMFDDYDEVMD